MRNHWTMYITAALTLLLVPRVAAQSPDLTRTWEVERAAVRASVSSTVPVTVAGGRPLGIAADFDGSGTLDYAMMTVRDEPGVTTNLAELSDRVRLYRQETQSVEFRMEVFYQRNGELGRAGELIFGRRMGIQGIELLNMGVDGDGAPAIKIVFLDPQATESHLVVFLPDGSVSQTILTATPNERAGFLDVTRDGLLDLLVTRRLPEAGRGFETYLEVHVLTDHGFELAASTNIVRNLQEFLAVTRSLIEERRWNELIEHAGGPFSDGSVHEQLLLMFSPVTMGDETPLPFVFAAEPLEIHEVVFPHVVDNPFSAPYLGSSIDLTFRVSCCDWEDHLYEVTIVLSPNPFYGRQYRFLTRAETDG